MKLARKSHVHYVPLTEIQSDRNFSTSRSQLTKLNFKLVNSVPISGLSARMIDGVTHLLALWHAAYSEAARSDHEAGI